MPNDQLTLDEPFAVPEPERVECDVSPEPWIEGATPSDAGRMPWRVPREVAVRVHTNKNLGRAGGQRLRRYHCAGRSHEGDPALA